MPTWRELEQEDQEQERRRLEALGPFGRIVDNHWTYVLLLCIVVPICFGIGLLIGIIMSW
jgi:hypothetical protein